MQLHMPKHKVVFTIFVIWWVGLFVFYRLAIVYFQAMYVDTYAIVVLSSVAVLWFDHNGQ